MLRALLCPQTEEKLTKTHFCVHIQKRNSEKNTLLWPQTEEKLWQRHISVSTDRKETMTRNGCLGSIETLCSWKSACFKYFRRISIKFSHLNHYRTNHRKLRNVLASNFDAHFEKSTDHIILRAGSPGLVRLFNGSQYSELLKKNH
jgi:hypothetical protein